MRSYAILDDLSRKNKAKKIFRIVERNGISSFRRVLEVGTGSGIIASYFALWSRAEIHAVDVIDVRQVTAGYQFQILKGNSLPFVGAFFDLVISNHVIEHVGSKENQEHHLQEIFRCLEPGGTLYLAVPNRWRLIEPHYNIPLLSWLPERTASSILRTLNHSSHYDCKPLSRKEVINLLHKSGFEWLDATLDAISLVGEIEGNFSARCFSKLPKSFLRFFSRIIPSLIFVCRKPTI